MMTRIVLPLVLLLAACGPRDSDGDGVPDAEDCNVDNPNVSPNRPDSVGDGVDTNCDGVDGVDADGDGVASYASGGGDCVDDDRFKLGDDLDNDDFLACMDCDDDDRYSYPGGEEVCDGADNDCDGTIDLGDDGIGLCRSTRGAGQQVDILFLIDNSTEMAPYQTDLALAAMDLRADLDASGIYYHIGVVSTDFPSDQGRLKTAGGEKWVDPDTDDPDQILSSMMQLGTGGAVQERGLDCAHRALVEQSLPGGFNEGFQRADTPLQLVILSDEDDSSFVSVSEFEEYLLQTVPWTRVHAVVSTDDSCRQPGLDYIDLAQRFGGQVVDVCTGDYSVALGTMAAELDGAGFSSFVLGAQLDPATLSATVVDGAGTPQAAYSPTELVWDATQTTATLPAALQAGESVHFNYALLPADSAE